MKMKPLEQIPFNPARWPFFYGWMILFWGIIGFLLSAPGQTTGVSAFIEPLIQQLGITRLDLSIAYGIGTFASSFLLTSAGRLFDRVGARWMAFGSALSLGGVLLLLSQTDHIASALATVIPRTFALSATLAVLFFLLRFSGQGVLTMASRNMMMKWFDRHRGLVSGISGAAIALGFSSAPSLLNGLINTCGWSMAWLWMGAALVLVFAPLLFIFFRDHPEASWLVPDGKTIVVGDQKTKQRHRQFTLSEARRTFAFWMFALAMALQSLVITSFTFHIESIFQHAGMQGSSGYSIFIPTSCIAVTVTLLGGWLSDRIQLRWLLATMLAAQCINLTGISLLAPGWAIALIILGGGVTGGLFGVLMSVTWPRYYGREHLGAISGQSMTLIVAASAIGPAFFSGILQLTGSYRAGFYLCLFVALLLLIGSFHARNPQENADSN